MFSTPFIYLTTQRQYNLILSNLCYVRFTGIIKDNYEKITISRAATDFLKQEEALRITRTEYDIEFIDLKDLDYKNEVVQYRENAQRLSKAEIILQMIKI